MFSEQVMAQLGTAELQKLSNDIQKELHKRHHADLVAWAFERFDFADTLKKLQDRMANTQQRYQQVLTEIAEGKSDKRIAFILELNKEPNVSPDEIRTYYLTKIEQKKTDFLQYERKIYAPLYPPVVMGGYEEFDLATVKAHAGYVKAAEQLTAALGMPVGFLNTTSVNGNSGSEYESVVFYAEVPLSVLQNTPA